MYGNYSSPIYTRAADNGQSEWGFQFHHQGMAYHPQLEDVLEQPVSNSSTASSGCSSYSSPSSLGSAAAHHLQRSESSHSLQNKNNGAHRALSSVAELLIDSQTSSVRRVYSTGDLQRIKMMQHSYRYSSSESPISSESNAIIEGMNKACRYSPEEKKERIERYRSKRNQRNFNKKIKYACRKTLADSRPRIRGRFARNEEIIERNCDEILGQDQDDDNQYYWTQINNNNNNNNYNNGIHEDQEDQYNNHDHDDDENWINLLDAFSSNFIPN
ncbi:hypothetical protein CsatB_030574 [Cannabis sativa]